MDFLVGGGKNIGPSPHTGGGGDDSYSIIYFSDGIVDKYYWAYFGAGHTHNIRAAFFNQRYLLFLHYLISDRVRARPHPRGRLHEGGDGQRQGNQGKPTGLLPEVWHT